MVARRAVVPVAIEPIDAPRRVAPGRPAAPRDRHGIRASRTDRRPPCPSTRHRADGRRAADAYDADPTIERFGADAIRVRRPGRRSCCSRRRAACSAAARRPRSPAASAAAPSVGRARHAPPPTDPGADAGHRRPQGHGLQHRVRRRRGRLRQDHRGHPEGRSRCRRARGGRGQHRSKVAEALGWPYRERPHPGRLEVPDHRPARRGRPIRLHRGPARARSSRSRTSTCRPTRTARTTSATARPPRRSSSSSRTPGCPAIQERLDVLPDLVEAGIPTFLTGDFNAPSHLDWTEAAVGLRPHVKYAMPWPVSMAVEAAGFRDAYRELHPDPVADPGLTWWAGRPADRRLPRLQRAAGPHRHHLRRRSIDDRRHQDRRRDRADRRSTSRSIRGGRTIAASLGDVHRHRRARRRRSSPSTTGSSPWTARSLVRFYTTGTPGRAGRPITAAGVDRQCRSSACTTDTATRRRHLGGRRAAGLGVGDYDRPADRSGRRDRLVERRSRSRPSTPRPR